MINNPALHEVPRSRPAAPIPLQRNASILDWLEGTGRLLAREVVEPEYAVGAEEEINELMSGEDNSFDVDDDDDAMELDE
jgi:hypothetical protein